MKSHLTVMVAAKHLFPLKGNQSLNNRGNLSSSLFIPVASAPHISCHTFGFSLWSWSINGTYTLNTLWFRDWVLFSLSLSSKVSSCKFYNVWINKANKCCGFRWNSELLFCSVSKHLFSYSGKIIFFSECISPVENMISMQWKHRNLVGKLSSFYNTLFPNVKNEDAQKNWSQHALWDKDEPLQKKWLTLFKTEYFYFLLFQEYFF